MDEGSFSQLATGLAQEFLKNLLQLGECLWAMFSIYHDVHPYLAGIDHFDVNTSFCECLEHATGDTRMAA